MTACCARSPAGGPTATTSLRPVTARHTHSGVHLDVYGGLPVSHHVPYGATDHREKQGDTSRCRPVGHAGCALRSCLASRRAALKISHECVTAAGIMLSLFTDNWLRVVPIELTSRSKGRKLLYARAVRHEHQRQHILRSPASCVMRCHGVLGMFLSILLPDAAVACSCGHYEQLLRYGNRAPSAHRR